MVPEVGCYSNTYPKYRGDCGTRQEEKSERCKVVETTEHCCWLEDEASAARMEEMSLRAKNDLLAEKSVRKFRP